MQLEHKLKGLRICTEHLAALSVAAICLRITATPLFILCHVQEGEGSGKRKAEDDDESVTKKAKKYVISDEEEEEDDE